MPDTEPTAPADIEALAVLLEAATPGPWNLDGPWWYEDDETGAADCTEVITAGDERNAVAVLPPRDLNFVHDRTANAALIAAAVNALPALLAEVKASREERARPAIDADHLAGQREWSERTFGPGPRLLGVLDHIRKELVEIEEDPTDVTEWVDVIILAFDGAWRAGWEPQQIIDAIKAKQARNEARTWPDWRTAAPDKAIEHTAEPSARTAS